MKLRPYQEADVERIKQVDCLGIFSEQRTGKTPTTIVGLWEKGVRRPVIICPASLVYNWAEEYKRWTGDPATVVESTKQDLTTWVEGALVINYEKLRATKKTTGMWQAVLDAKPEAVIIDEAHRIKTRPTRANKAYTTRAVFKLKKIPIRLALTGTPAYNKPQDLYNILHFLFPRQYTSYWNWIEEYFEQRPKWTPNGMSTDIIGIAPAKKEVFQQNLDILCIMHKRKEVMSWLEDMPDPTVIKLPCTKQQKKYIDDLEQWFETDGIITQGVLDNLIRIRQVCGAPEILGLKGRSPKIDWLQQYVKDFPEKSILVFSNSRKLLELAQPKVKGSFIVSGAIGLRDRQHAVKNFQEGKTKVLLIQTQAGKEGLTLDQADVTIFLDTYPPAADYTQAKDRMVATTPERNKPKELIHVMMGNTYDEVMYQLVKNNIDATAVINDYYRYIKERKEEHNGKNVKKCPEL